MSGMQGDFVGGTRRADGSIRKVRQVKAGYTPPDEQKKFDTAAAKFNNYARSGGPAGMAGLSLGKPAALAKGGQKTKNQIKNDKKKAAALKKKLAAADGLLEAEDAEAAAPTSAPTPPAPAAATDPAKRAKNLRKKLKGIDALQAKIDGGELAEANLDADQKKKLAGKADILAELEQLGI